MNILFLADNFPPETNAQASRVYERARYWVQWGHQVTVLTCAPNFPEGKVFAGYTNDWYFVEEISGIRVVRVKTFFAANKGRIRRIADFLSFMVAAFTAGLFQREAEIVVATSPQFFAAVAGWALSKVKRVPFVFELSDLWPESIVAVGAMKRSVAIDFIEKIELFLYRQSARIIALTSSFKDNLVRRGIPADKIAVVTNGVELSTYYPRPKNKDLAQFLGIREDEFVIGYIGTLGMAHGLDNVLNAAERLRGRNIRFLLIGPGAERNRLTSEVQRRSLENITLVPSQPKDAMPDCWSLCDVALVHLKDSPLFKTVLPSKMFEAMGMGVPVLLVAPDGEASRIVRSENIGVCVPPADPQALADVARQLESDRDLLLELSKSSLSAAPRHSRERQADEMLTNLNAVFGLPSSTHYVPKEYAPKAYSSKKF